MVLIFVVSVLIIFIVLIQNPKGGGLVSSFSASAQIMGVRRTADFIEKATWSLAVILLVLSLLASMSIPRNTEDPNKSKLEDKVLNMPGKNETPILPNVQTEKQNNNKK
jgi:preprotein translocase subunit SecG